MKKSLVLFFIIIISISCCTHIPKDIKGVESIEEIKKFVNTPHVVMVQGTTPKIVVYEEEPIPILKVRPEYPQSAKEAGIMGQVLIRAEVFEDGTVGSVEIVEGLQSGPGGIDECAIKAVKQWKFIPAKLQNKPIAVWVTFPIRFQN